ncbi:hypothetical protein B0T13DRAFT_30300 [Neurospora crassa]|nr:hypothetical protein B0T13DRAFT_30300 [Neurospora crassa]
MWNFAYLCVLVCNVNPVVRCRNPSLRSSLSSTVPSLTINFSAPASRARMTSALAERNFCPGWRGKRHNVPGLYEWPGRVWNWLNKLRQLQVPGLQACPTSTLHTPATRTAPWKHGSMTAASNNDGHLSGGGMTRIHEIVRGGAWEGRSVSGQLVSGCTVWSKKFDDGSRNTKQHTSTR